MEYVNKQRRNVFYFSEFGYGSWEFNSRRVHLHLTKYIKWVGIIAINTERTQIHFLSDILVAVASLDLSLQGP